MDRINSDKVQIKIRPVSDLGRAKDVYEMNKVVTIRSLQSVSSNRENQIEKYNSNLMQINFVMKTKIRIKQTFLTDPTI